jgi:hypothetical protein
MLLSFYKRPMKDMKTGRPQIIEVMQGIGKDMQGKRVKVYACGPKPLTRAVWDASTAIKPQLDSLAFHREIFEL